MALLDNFNRANEGPPPSTNWTTPTWDTGCGVMVESNQAVPFSSTDGLANVAVWNAATFGPDCATETTVTRITHNAYSPGHTAVEYIRLYLRSDTTDITDGEYYQAHMEPTSYAGDWYWSVNIRSSAEFIGAGDTIGIAQMSEGDQFRFEVVGDLLTLYLKPFGGGSFVSILSKTIPNPLSNTFGYLALSLRTSINAFAVDDFGGETISGGAPVANFSGTPTSGPAPLSVAFTDSSTNTPTSWSWTFGDGNTSTDQNPTHVYSTPGTYTVALTATNGDGSDTETKTDYITVLGAPVADFSGTPTSGTVSLSVAFTDLSTNSPDTWYWFFGDGSTATTQNPTHVYTLVGVYTVALTASSSAGSDSETKIAYITVTDTAEVGPAEIENCDIDTGGLATGLRVADVAIARDNNLGSLLIDASAELRVKDNAYGTLTNNGTLTSLAGDRSVWDTTNFAVRHARDIDEATGQYHLVSAATQAYTISNPSTDRAYDVTALTLNELAAVVGTLIADLKAKGLLS